ncbi:MAG: type II toxin-antitoxin system RelE/ParE family toxin [Thermoplasmata archaeon]
MERIRTIVAYKNYFVDFLAAQPVKVQNKIYKILELVEYQQQIPTKFIKHIEGTGGLYETRFSLGNNIWRVFCFFDEGKLVILLNGFQKKTQKTPKTEIERAERLRQEYYKEKRRK